MPWSEGSCLLFHRVASWVLHLQNIRIKYRKKVPDISLDVTLTHSKYLNFAEVTIKVLNGSYIVFLHKLQIHINLSTFCLCDNQDDNVGSIEYGLSQTTLFRPRDWSTTNYWVMREKWVDEGCWQSQENWKLWLQSQRPADQSLTPSLPADFCVWCLNRSYRPHQTVKSVMLLEMEKIHLKIKNGTSRNILAAAMRHNSERMTAGHASISGDKHGKKNTTTWKILVPHHYHHHP